MKNQKHIQLRNNKQKTVKQILIQKDYTTIRVTKPLVKQLKDMKKKSIEQAIQELYDKQNKRSK